MLERKKLIYLGGIILATISTSIARINKGYIQNNAVYEVKNEKESLLEKLNGDWEGVLEDGTDIRFTYSNKKHKLILSSAKGKFYNYGVEKWEIDEDEIKITVEYRCSIMVYKLKMKNEEELEGSYLRNKKEMPITLLKTDDEPIIKGFYSNEFNYELEDKQLELRRYSLYEKDTMQYWFTYDTKKERCQEFIEQYQLADIVKGKTDIELMHALLLWVGENCEHDGRISTPISCTPENIMKTCKENHGINARGLSILLAELLRAYGIKARPVMCMPGNDLVTECTTVVEAYSELKNQWIMLDPVYRLILKTEDNAYVNLRMLRDAIRDGEKLIPNKEASRNGLTFNLENYLYYMAKNVFCFSSPENLYYGADEVQNQNRRIVLVPKGYEEPRIVLNGLEVITTDDERFWAKP